MIFINVDNIIITKFHEKIYKDITNFGNQQYKN